MKIVTNMLFPPRCVVCDELLEAWNRTGIHGKCKPLLLPVEGNCCMHCGAPLETRGEYCLDCGRKIRRNEWISFSQGKACFVYEGKIKEAMYRFKYSNKREYGEFWARVAAEKYGDWIRNHGIEAVVAVPMYGWKQRRRGYNQAQVFAKALARELGIPCERNLVKRVKNMAPMKNIEEKERKDNLKNAFQINKNIVQYYYILLVDDIYTTGSTADAVTEALLSSGVKEVYFLSICIGQGY